MSVFTNVLYRGRTGFLMPATAAMIDFSNDETLLPLTGTAAPARIGSKGGIIGRPVTSKEQKQIRQRARRKLRKLSPEEQRALYGKDVSEWDMEELARGRPRNKNGTFSGPAPTWISRQLHEEIVRRFETVVKDEMNGQTIDALKVLTKVLTDEEVDTKGRRRTPRSVQVDVAKFLLEHVVGKPKTRVEADISVKLQGILGVAIANPSQNDMGQYELTAGYIDMPSWEEEVDAEEQDS